MTTASRQKVGRMMTLARARYHRLARSGRRPPAFILRNKFDGRHQELAVVSCDDGRLRVYNAEGRLVTFGWRSLTG
jgi:hypothetical protein